MPPLATRISAAECWAQALVGRVLATMADARIIAVGLLTQRDVDLLGPTFERLWPVEETPCFSQLLAAIDNADRDRKRDRNVAENEVSDR